MSEIKYGDGLYTVDIAKHAKEYLAVLPRDVKVLVSMGSSGCAIASAMLALSRRKLEHFQYRKDGEHSHAQDRIGKIAYGKRKPPPKTKIAIVDDFITTGKTIATLIDRAIKDKQNIRGIIISKIWDEEALKIHLCKIKKYPILNVQNT